MVELTMRDSRARAHPLHFADPDDRAGAETVLVFERTFQNVGDDLHVAMPMSRESGAGANSILVDHPQRAKPALRRVVIFAERKRVPGIEPTNPGTSTISGLANSNHLNSPIPGDDGAGSEPLSAGVTPAPC